MKKGKQEPINTPEDNSTSIWDNYQAPEIIKEKPDSDYPKLSKELVEELINK
jgi:hypothetical protein